MWPNRGQLGPEVTVGHTARPELAGEGREVTLVVVGLDRKDFLNRNKDTKITNIHTNKNVMIATAKY